MAARGKRWRRGNRTRVSAGEARFLEAAARSFDAFGRGEARAEDPLYAVLSAPLSKDKELLLLLRGGAKGQPLPNLLFAAVHYLLLKTPRGEPLAEFYPDLASQLRPAGGAYPVFREFCLRRSADIEKLVAARLVQTNEVRRCCALVPAFAVALDAAGQRPAAFLEIGASAGLNLLWDRYRYDYGAGLTFGPPQSSVALRCELRGAGRPRLPSAVPEVRTRVGIDLNPIDVLDADSILWLNALIWPYHSARRALLEASVAVARAQPVRLVRGDVRHELPGVLKELRGDSFLCVYHTMVYNQLTSDQRPEVDAMLGAEGKRRDLAVVGMTWWPDQPAPQLSLTLFASGRMTHQVLGHCAPHGDWLEWTGPSVT
ncbi:MAG: DUF2332 domain-containing protein [Candidatus Eremiobacteraeota bacterium]|nr:DUF2332 domain-containing protein [Candidatus Eremiobacteraeota bacterium]